MKALSLFLLFGSLAAQAAPRKFNCFWAIDPANEIGVVDEYAAYVEETAGGNLYLTAWHTESFTSDVIKRVPVTASRNQNHTSYKNKSETAVLKVYRGRAPGTSLNGQLDVTTPSGKRFSHYVNCK